MNVTGILPEERTCHLDRGYDGIVTQQLLDELGFDGAIARKGVPAPVQEGTRWTVENPRLDDRLLQAAPRRRTDAKVVDFYLAAALITIRQLIQCAHRP